MRRRDLIRRLRESREELRNLTYGGLFGAGRRYRQNAERRLVLLHELETMLPEIIKRLRDAA